MLTHVGDDEIDIIEFSNGLKIHMEFGIKENGPWGWRGRLSGKYRRIQLFNSEDELLDELIESNPLYTPNLHMDIPADSNIIY